MRKWILIISFFATLPAYAGRKQCEKFFDREAMVRLRHEQPEVLASKGHLLYLRELKNPKSPLFRLDGPAKAYADALLTENWDILHAQALWRNQDLKHFIKVYNRYFPDHLTIADELLANIPPGLLIHLIPWNQSQWQDAMLRLGQAYLTKLDELASLLSKDEKKLIVDHMDQSLYQQLKREDAL